MLVNKRWVERFPAKLKVRFGQDTFSDNGRVQNISMFGFFIKTPEVFPNGTLLTVQLLTSEKQLIKVLGVVQWSADNRKNSEAAEKEKGMGIKISSFQEGQEIYKKLCQEFFIRELN